MKRSWPFVLVLMCLFWTGIAVSEEEKGCKYQPPETEYQWVTTGSNVIMIGTGFRATHHNWYAELGMGGLKAFENRENAFFLNLNFGRRFMLIPRLFLGVDLGYRHVIPDGSENPSIDTGKYFNLEGRIKLEVVLGRHMSLFLGGGHTKLYQGYSLGSDTVSKGTLFWGVGLI